MTSIKQETSIEREETQQKQTKNTLSTYYLPANMLNSLYNTITAEATLPCEANELLKQDL